MVLANFKQPSARAQLFGAKHQEPWTFKFKVYTDKKKEIEKQTYF